MVNMNLNGIVAIALLLGTLGCQAQSENVMEEKKNPLLCDPAEGFCELPGDAAQTDVTLQAKKKPVKIVYFTDPICSSCWGIEPQLRKLKLEYGNSIEIEYHMGGLLPDWSYNSGGISKPSDVAHHWDEVSGHYDMPIDGDVWLEDPLHSSYPPSIAFKAAQLQDQHKAFLFLRAIRELVFLQKKNITKWEYLEEAASIVGLDVEQFQIDYNNRAKALFEADLKLARQMGVRGFPTLFFSDSLGHQKTVYGSKPYATYETALKQLAANVTKMPYAKNWEALFSKHSSLTAKEFAELSSTPRAQSEEVLNGLVEQGQLKKLTTKNGDLWMVKSTNP